MQLVIKFILFLKIALQGMKKPLGDIQEEQSPARGPNPSCKIAKMTGKEIIFPEIRDQGFNMSLGGNKELLRNRTANEHPSQS